MSILHATKESEGTLLLTFTGEITGSGEAKQLRDDIDIVSKSIRELHGKEGKGIKVLVDITNFKAGVVAEAIDALIGLAREDKKYVFRTATFGGSVQLRTIGETIAALAGRKNIKFFETKEEAVKWLSEASAPPSILDDK